MNEDSWMQFIGGVALFSVVIIWIFSTMVEQSTFNRFSDKKVSFLEAAFSELRIEAK